MDSNSDSNEGRKKMTPTLKLTIVFLCMAAILTFYSRTMYNAGIPTVHIAPVKSETLRIVYEGEGIITPRETASLYAPGDFVVTEVFVKQYDTVEEGDVMATFDISGLENELADMNTSYKKLVATRDNTWNQLVEGKISKTDWDLANLLLDMDISDTARHIANLKERIEQGSGLYAPSSGIVIGIFAQPGMMSGRYSPLFELCDSEKGFVITHVIPEEYTQYFNKATVFPVGSIHQIPGTITRRTPAADGGIEITIELEPERATLQPDIIATFELVEVTEKLPALVPVTAITDGAFVYKLIETEGPLGTEYRVSRIAVEIEVQSEGWASVKGDIGKGDDVVISSDRPLSDERVKIYQEG